MKDLDVPWQHAMKLLERLEGDPAITLVKQGDHRLSTEQDLAQIRAAADALLAEI